MLAERHCINNNLSHAELLSTEFVISCDNLDYGCQGGHLDNTVDFLSSQSVPTVSCSLFNEYILEPLEYCPVESTDMQESCKESEWLMCAQNTKRHFTNKEQMMREIYE